MDYAKKLEAEKGLKLVEFEDLAALQQAVANGQVEAAINDLPVWTEYLKKNPGGFEVAAEFDTGEQYGFPVKKDANPGVAQEDQRGAGQGQAGRHVQHDLREVDRQAAERLSAETRPSA